MTSECTMRRLRAGDFTALWNLGLPYIDKALTPEPVRAQAAYIRIIGDQGSLYLGDFDKSGDLKGAIMVQAIPNAYARKSHANVVVWLGRVALLDVAIGWWESRAVLRMMSIQFPRETPAGIYRMLASRGFERSGDMNVLRR